jgi:hypothetical protein
MGENCNEIAFGGISHETIKQNGPAQGGDRRGNPSSLDGAQEDGRVLSTYNEPLPGLVRSKGEAAVKVAFPLFLPNRYRFTRMFPLGSVYWSPISENRRL